MKKQPDLNKVKFTKLHRKKRLIRVNKGNKGKANTVYGLGMVLKNSATITVNQLEAVRKLIIRKLKSKENKNQKNLKIIKSQVKKRKSSKKKKKVLEKQMVMKHNFCLGLTKKPLQVRMGKGKGSPVDWVFPCKKDRILIEFSTKRLKLRKIKRILEKSSEKLPSTVKFKRINAESPLKTHIKFNSISANSTQNIKLACVKEL